MKLARTPLLLAVAASGGCILIAGLLATVTGAATTLVRPAWAVENCRTKGSTLSLESTAYAVMPEEVLDGLGTRKVEMIWHDRDNSDTVTITVQSEATEVTTYTDAGCQGVVALPVDVTLTTPSRRLDETWSGDARVRLDDALWTVIVDWTPEALDGSLQPPEITKDNQTWERFGLQVRFGEESTLGGVRGEVIRDNGSKRYIALGLIGGDSVSEIEDGLVIETDTDQDTDFEPVPTPDDD